MPFTPPPLFDDIDLPRAIDPVADDIASRNPDSGDISAGEQVLDEGHVAPEPDDFENGDTVANETADDAANADEVADTRADETTDAGETPDADETTDADGDTSADRAQAADERTDPGAPPAQTEPGS